MCHSLLVVLVSVAGRGGGVTHRQLRGAEEQSGAENRRAEQRSVSESDGPPRHPLSLLLCRCAPVPVFPSCSPLVYLTSTMCALANFPMALSVACAVSSAMVRRTYDMSADRNRPDMAADGRGREGEEEGEADEQWGPNGAMGRWWVCVRVHGGGRCCLQRVGGDLCARRAGAWIEMRCDASGRCQTVVRMCASLPVTTNGRARRPWSTRLVESNRVRAHGSHHWQTR